MENSVSLTTEKGFKTYSLKGACEVIKTAAREFSKTVALLTGKEEEFFETDSFSCVKAGVCFALFSDVENFGGEFSAGEEYLRGSDGFAVLKDGERIFVLSHTPRGVYYGAHDLLEKNADVVWGRGAREYAVDYLPCEKITFSVVDYAEKSPFSVRVWNTCGKGSEGKDHIDDGTAYYYAKNKTNGIFHAFESAWKNHGLCGVGAVAPYANNIDDLAERYPEYFMTGLDGKPKLSTSESFINYYNADAAKVVAKRFVEFLNSDGADEGNLYSLIMPDNPYFYVEEGGCVKSAEPFTADDGTTVYPTAENYKSTVYFNFMNRVAKEVNRLRPNTYFLTFAYLYSERVPAIQTDEHLIVSLAPIYTNERYSYIDENRSGNKKIAENIEAWSKVCQKLCIYSYWDSFKGTAYMRPILKQVKENLLWFEKLGVYGLTAEGKLDCSLVEGMSEAQKSARKFFDMNEACTWVMQKLIWNPKEDIDGLLRRYAKIVYKEAADEFLEYYRLIEKGYESTDAYVWYATGGDVYILQFIVNAGIKDEVLSLLKRAKEKAFSPSVKERVQSIYDSLSKQIEKYADFVKEEGTITYTDVGAEEILSPRSLDYKNNPKSVWNKAVPMTVLRNYETMEFYDKAANFECRMLYDGENAYVGYSVTDDKIAFAERDEKGLVKVIREDGERLISYAETYIGGNELNQSTYYGYISGFTEAKGGAFYQNSGVPVRIKEERGLEDFYFVKTSENPKERYYFHVQKIPIAALGVSAEDFKPYGSFVYYSNRFKRAGWMGFGLWSKQNFQKFEIRRKCNGRKS